MKLNKQYYIEGSLINEGTEVLIEGEFNDLVIDASTAEPINCDEFEKLVKPVMAELEKEDLFDDNDRIQIKKDAKDFLIAYWNRYGKVPEAKLVKEYLLIRSPGFAK